MQVNWLWRKENPEAFFEEIETNLVVFKNLNQNVVFHSLHLILSCCYLKKTFTAFLNCASIFSVTSLIFLHSPLPRYATTVNFTDYGCKLFVIYCTPKPY